MGIFITRVEGGQVIVTKRVEGEVQFNDGEFAEVQTYGIEGIEKDLLLKTVHIHLEDTDNTSDEFQKRFSVGTVLEITTTTEFTIKLEPGLDWQDLRTAVSGGRVN
jgi:urease beta subunit